jgi:hypothetical protein
MAREFIDRDHQYPPDTNTRAGDQLRTQSSVDAMKAAPRGEPLKAFDVRAVYDSRPVQGFDFNINVAGTPIAVSSSVFIATFQVPSGYVAVLRTFHHSFTPPPIIVNRSDIKATLLLNKQNVQYNANIPIGIESDGVIDCFVIADEFNTLGVRIDGSAATLSIAGSIPQCHFYGQFLLKTGIPKNFEIANPSGKAVPPRRQPMMPPRPPAPQPQQQPQQQQPQMQAQPVQQSVQTQAVKPTMPPITAPSRPSGIIHAQASRGSAGQPIYGTNGKIIGYSR